MSHHCHERPCRRSTCLLSFLASVGLTVAVTLIAITVGENETQGDARFQRVALRLGQDETDLREMGARLDSAEAHIADLGTISHERRKRLADELRRERGLAIANAIGEESAARLSADQRLAAGVADEAKQRATAVGAVEKRLKEIDAVLDDLRERVFRLEYSPLDPGIDPEPAPAPPAGPRWCLEQIGCQWFWVLRP